MHHFGVIKDGADKAPDPRLTGDITDPVPGVRNIKMPLPPFNQVYAIEVENDERPYTIRSLEEEECRFVSICDFLKAVELLVMGYDFDTIKERFHEQ